MGANVIFHLLVLHSARQRILERVEVWPTGCWYWLGSGDGRYGQIRLFGARFKTHVAAFLLWNGRIPRRHVLAHQCDNTGCCNPEHLENKLQRHNIQEASERQRLPNALGRRKVALIRRLLTRGWAKSKIARHVKCHRDTVRKIERKQAWK